MGNIKLNCLGEQRNGYISNEEGCYEKNIGSC